MPPSRWSRRRCCFAALAVIEIPSSANARARWPLLRRCPRNLRSSRSITCSRLTWVDRVEPSDDGADPRRDLLLCAAATSSSSSLSVRSSFSRRTLARSMSWRMRSSSAGSSPARCLATIRLTGRSVAGQDDDLYPPGGTKRFNTLRARKMGLRTCVPKTIRVYIGPQIGRALGVRRALLPVPASTGRLTRNFGSALRRELL